MRCGARRPHGFVDPDRDADRIDGSVAAPRVASSILTVMRTGVTDGRALTERAVGLGFAALLGLLLAFAAVPTPAAAQDARFEGERAGALGFGGRAPAEVSWEEPAGPAA